MSNSYAAIGPLGKKFIVTYVFEDLRKNFSSQSFCIHIRTLKQKSSTGHRPQGVSRWEKGRRVCEKEMQEEGGVGGAWPHPLGVERKKHVFNLFIFQIIFSFKLPNKSTHARSHLS